MNLVTYALRWAMNLVIDAILRIVNLDMFQPTNTYDPLLNEKRIRERRLAITYLGALAAIALSVTVTSDAVPITSNRVNWVVYEIRNWIPLVGIGVASLATLWQSVGYLRFCRNIGLD